MATFTAAYSRLYQSEQNCQCMDNDHDECSADSDSVSNFDKTSTGILKRSRRIRRVCLMQKIYIQTFFFLSKGYSFETQNRKCQQRSFTS